MVCATPRTGSSLLLGLLDSSGVAGHPEAYFRDQDQATWAGEWGLGDSYEYLDFVRTPHERSDDNFNLKLTKDRAHSVDEARPCG